MLGAAVISYAAFPFCVLDLYYGGSVYPIQPDKMEYALQSNGLLFASFLQSATGTYVAISSDPTGLNRSIMIYSLVLVVTGRMPQTIVWGVNFFYFLNANDKITWPGRGHLI